MQIMKQDDKRVFELKETISSWDADYYHPIAQGYYDAAVRTMLDCMGAKPGETVLDAGCGPGVHSIRAARQGMKVVAADISEAMLEEAGRRVCEAGFSSDVLFQKEDLTALSFADASFKHVFCWGVVIHIREVVKSLNELARVVAPGGRLALYITNRDALDHSVETAARLVTGKPLELEHYEIGSAVCYDMHGEGLWVWRLDTQAVTRHFERLGFRRTHLLPGELTEIQWRLGGPLRRSLLRMNSLFYTLRMPARWAATNLIIFEKAAA